LSDKKDFHMLPEKRLLDATTKIRIAALESIYASPPRQILSLCLVCNVAVSPLRGLRQPLSFSTPSKLTRKCLVVSVLVENLLPPFGPSRFYVKPECCLQLRTGWTESFPIHPRRRDLVALTSMKISVTLGRA
jgi:hypothetical protein